MISFPAGVLQKLLGFGRVVAEALLRIRRPRPHTLRKWPHADLVDAEEDLFDYRLAIHCPIDGLAHSQIIGGRFGDIHIETKRVAAPRRLDEGEALVGLQAGVVRLGQFVDQQALT